MNSRFNEFIKTSLIGGLIVMLPSVILLVTFGWILKKITNILAPLTLALFGKDSFSTDLLSIAVLIAVCFTLGVVVKTKTGNLLHKKLEQYLYKAPGYITVKQIIDQLLGRKKTPYSSVVLARPFQNDTLVTAFVTDEHENDIVTIFVPTGPNPTTGNIFHLHKKYIQHVNASVERTIQTIISCGAGTSELISKGKLPLE